MDCISPTVDISVLLRNNQNKDDNEVTVGFIMDAVEEVRKLEFDFNIVDDPEYYPFMGEENIKEHHGGQLFVRGKNLNLAATESEVTVIIGQEECKVISLSNVQLNCIPPDTQPKGVNKSGNPTENGLPTVIVGIGNLEFFIGYLKYPVTGQASLSVPVGNIVAVFALLVVVTTAIVAVYYLRNRKLDRQIAEAEERLQTIVMAIRAGPDISVPFSDYRKYTANMIYDLHTAKQELRRSLQNNNDRTMDLAKFYSLLTNKSFCLVFIRTLEQQSKITKDEKKAIGSLLTITVQNEKNMLYLPEILEELLTDAVIKADRTKKGTLKLKRKNSIVEFMLTAWIAITLYSHIKTYIGESLYDLFLVMTIRADMEPRKIFRGLAKERVNRVFEKILTFNDQPPTYFPAPIKYMCDMLDSVAEKCGINEEHVTRRWKCNSLHLGLWVKILQRPQLVFDINPSKDVKRGFRIIAQAFTEICSKTTRSTSKATELYEEISTFKTQLQKYFDDVKALPSVSKGALKRYLEENLQVCDINLRKNSILLFYHWNTNHRTQIQIFTWTD
ncbi:plexin-B-like isoform X2 [Ptychodera flava]|uniref:plexin-B-like isoform X2 n=1 Tax=Ptychodera flava TaxID=63121 RepID=UPI00396A035A